MTVNRSSLVESLVQKTGLEQDQVEEQLNLLIEKVQTEIEKGKEYQAGGLGTFFLEDGEIVFKPEENLATEINFKYAGMKPIELIGAFKEVPGDEVSAQESAISPISDVEEYSEAMASEEGEPAEELAAGIDPVEEMTDEKTEETPPVEQKAEVINSPEELAEEHIEQKDLEPEQSEDPAVSKPEPSKKEYRPKKKEETADPIGKILVAAVIIMAIGVSGWMFYDLGYIGSDSNSSGNTVTESRADQNLGVIGEEPEDAEDNKSGADSVSIGSVAGENKSSEQNESNSISNVSSIAEESRQSIYGLRGGASPRVEDGYTIVVHSLRDEAKVHRLNEQLQKEGYRTVISQASIMDTTFWRLGLGQFKTIKDATEASQQLPDPYRNNHFIKRIQ